MWTTPPNQVVRGLENVRFARVFVMAEKFFFLFPSTHWIRINVEVLWRKWEYLSNNWAAQLPEERRDRINSRHRSHAHYHWCVNCSIWESSKLLPDHWKPNRKYCSIPFQAQFYKIKRLIDFFFTINSQSRWWDGTLPCGNKSRNGHSTWELCSRIELESRWPHSTERFKWSESFGKTTVITHMKISTKFHKLSQFP